MIFFFVFITFLLDIVSILWEQILSRSPMATGNWVYDKDNLGLFVTVTLTESSKTVHECVTVHSNTKAHKTMCIVHSPDHHLTIRTPNNAHSGRKITSVQFKSRVWNTVDQNQAFRLTYIKTIMVKNKN